MALIKWFIFAIILQNTIAVPVIDWDWDDELTTTEEPYEEEDVECIKEHVYYKISNSNGGNLAANLTSTSEVIVTYETDSDYEKWLFVKVQTTLGTQYVIINKFTKAALTFNEDKFQLQTPVYNKNQLFVIGPAETGLCSILIANYQSSAHNFQILSIESTSNPAITAKTISEADMNLLTWKPIEYPCDPVPNQPYSLVHVESGLPAGIIAYPFGNQLKLRSEKVYSENDSPIRSQAWNQFEFMQTDGLFKIYNKHGNLGLFANRGDSSLEDPTIFGDPQKGDQFKIHQTNDGFCLISESVSDQALEGISSEIGYEEGSLIQLKTKNGLLNQQWTLEPYGQPIVNQYLPYRIKNRDSGKVMEIEDDYRGSAIVVNDFDQTKTNQLFYFDTAETFGYFYIRSDMSGLNLDIEFSYLSQYRQENAPYQRMKLVVVEGLEESQKYFKIVPESQPDKSLTAQITGQIRLENDDDFRGHWELIPAQEPYVTDKEAKE